MDASDTLHRDRVKRWTRTALEDGVEARTIFAVAQNIFDIEEQIKRNFAVVCVPAFADFRKEQIKILLETEEKA